MANRTYSSHGRKYTAAVRRTMVAEQLKYGKSFRAIAEYVAQQFGRPKPISLAIIHSDAKFLLKELQDVRIKDTELKLERELLEIDHTISELWDQWEKSKLDQKIKTQKQKGEIIPGDPKLNKEETIIPTQVEKTTKDEINLGDVRYIAEIREQQKERRRLEGTYDKNDETINPPTLQLDVKLQPEDLQSFREYFDKRF